ncbi:MAG: HAMP domain-containing histidine kinase [Deltaproteobacteria bacterium]|nr:HAMP domain-containing histidine kinase [Deltaproteobacteria bacterium]
MAATMLLAAAVVAALSVSAVSQAVLAARARDVRSADSAIAAVQRVSIAVRDAYAHQAHTVILQNRTHLGHYQKALHDARAALATARPLLRGQDLEGLESIALGLEALDENFTTSLLPNVESGGAPLEEAHDRALDLIMEAQESANHIAAHLEAAAREAEAAARVAERWTVALQLAVLAIALLLSATVALSVDRTISRPLLALEAAARRLAAGDLSARAAPERDDELGSLARRLNEMAVELDQREKRLLDAERLAGIGRLAAGVAHEINNPLGVMLGYARLIERRDDEAIREDARAIVDEIARCQSIVGGLLDLARPHRLKLADTDLAALAHEVAERMGDTRRVEVRARGDVVTAIDDGKVRQILNNLVQNAIEAAPTGAIAIDVDGEDAEVIHVRVSDEGPGIAAEVRGRLFEPFATTKAKGTGLGLAVSASLARAHRGELSLVDTPRGACFSLRIPRTLRTPAPGAPNDGPTRTPLGVSV